MKPVLHVGIDVGSTTVKVVALSPYLKLLFGKYQRHMSDIRKTTIALLKEMQKKFPGYRVTASISGSGGMGLAKLTGLPFCQEILAETKAIRTFHPETDVIIELGGEDEKITYLRNGVDQRMNGACAGGTGAFIDRMATLLSTDASGLQKLAAKAKRVYPIASRCGVFAKTDIQALLNEGASHEDIAASVFQSVVNQTISGLTCGRPIRGKVAFLGGPLTFMPELRKHFQTTLDLSDDSMIVPEHGELYVAIGAAVSARHDRPFDFDTWLSKVESKEAVNLSNIETLPPLFKNQEEYDAFKKRHASFHAPRGDLSKASGPLWVGIDAGSTTIKAVLLDGEGRILYEFYSSNKGTPLEGAKKILADMYGRIPKGAYICGAGVTGYGENLIQKALKCDTGEVETMAHYRSARHFLPGVTTILDIGGQDMKCSTIKDGAVDSIKLNEACSSGCGSFLDTFAQSLGTDIKTFSHEALFAKHPVDLGSRCTVFMNSRVREAQKNEIPVADISAGLSYSVIKNALYKVIRLHNAGELGKQVVVQGGTFYNDAVLRALELLLGRNVIRPDIAGLMGAYGMALITKERCPAGHKSTLVSMEELSKLSIQNEMKRCPGCGNHCMITITHFSDGRAFVSGNRCERGASIMLTGKSAPHSKYPNIYRWKYDTIWRRRSLSPGKATRGTVGIPRVLNLYEDYPFWHAFFTKLGYRVITSLETIREIPTEAMETIPSYSECFPAKIAHAHIFDLARRKPTFIWYPCIDKGPEEGSDNSYNCPMVTSYPETIAGNMDELLDHFQVPFLHPFLPLYSDKIVKRLEPVLKPYHISTSEIKEAVKAGRAATETYRKQLKEETEKILQYVNDHHMLGIVLAGRPYHVDPAVNHSIPDLINQLGMAVLSEDGVSLVGGEIPTLRVLNQWTYHSRLYKAADYVTRHPNLELVELNSFGCGLDAVVTDQVQEIMQQRGRLYTCLKIDQSLNLGAVRIRLRSLKAAIQERVEQSNHIRPISYHKAAFTKEMKKDYTILVPELSPIHFPMIAAAGQACGYHMEVLPPTREDINTGLGCVNNDACYPSIITIGSLLHALQSGKYDLHKTAVVMSQTGGACRASNYIGFIHRALDEAGLSDIPVISLNTQGLDPQPGFKLTLPMANKLVEACVYGDALQAGLLRTRPYESSPGSAEQLVKEWQKKCIDSLMKGTSRSEFKSNVRAIIRDFDRLPLNTAMPRRPRIGIVGEIYVKFSPIASNDVIRLIEANGGEAETSGLLDFFLYGSLDSRFQREHMNGSFMDDLKHTFMRGIIEWYRKPLVQAMKDSKRFHAPTPIQKMAKRTEQYASLGNRAGEGWFLTADMVDLLQNGCRGVVCLQPFACLPNHITGEGMIHKLHMAYPEAVFLALDCDASASEVNQANRLKLMMNSLTEKEDDASDISFVRKAIQAKEDASL